MMRWAAKAISAMRHSGRAPFVLGHLARTKYNYAREVGSGMDSSVVTAPVQWIQRAFPEAELTVMRTKGDDTEAVSDHAMPALVANPNPFYAGDALWSATLFSYLVAGNGYWLKARDGGGVPRELWYTPHWTLKPMWPDDGSVFISHYEYKPGGTSAIRVDPEDVVHFRHGIDPQNLRLGLSPLQGAMREIFMDLEASNFVASLLRNMGVPGVVLSPDGGAQAGTDDVAAVKKWFDESFGGDRRGKALVMGAATKVQSFGFNPNQMDLSVARNVAEERVCADLGIPAAVVGFGSGLQTAKVGATMSELRKLAWTNGMLPYMRSMASELDRSLLPDFGDAANDESVFDTSAVAALEEDAEKRATRWDTMVRGGWAKVAEAREGMGLDTDESHDIYLRPFSAIEVPAGAAPRVIEAEPEEEAEEEDDPETANLRWPPGAKGKAARRRPTAAQQAYVAALEKMERPLALAFEPRLKSFFGALGKAAGVAAEPLLLADDIDLSYAAGDTKEAETKADEVLVGRIIEQLELPLHQTTFKNLLEAQYLNVAEEVSKAGELVGLATNLPDPVARAVVAAGGRRSGLVDLTTQSRKALFDALAEGRAAGEGAEQLAARIAGQVESGPWQTAETRARTIARTETKFAQNTSTIARAQHEGVQRFLMFDGRLGDGVSDPDHIARDGSVVTADQAAQLAAEEHPNGTLSFSPIFDDEE